MGTASIPDVRPGAGRLRVRREPRDSDAEKRERDRTDEDNTVIAGAIDERAGEGGRDELADPADDGDECNGGTDRLLRDEALDIGIEHADL